MFKQQILVLLSVSISFLGAFAQIPDISFNNNNNTGNTWSTNASVVTNTTLNKATITGNGTNFTPRTTLSVTLQNGVPTELYFVAEVKFTNVAFNSHNIKNPQLTIKNGTATIGRINLKFPMKDTWFTTGVKVSNLGTTSTTLTLEAGINGTTGTMEIRNPYLTTTPPAFTYQFPFTVPSNVSTSINVDLSQKKLFENDILSANTHFIFAKLPWSEPKLQNAITTYFPMTNLRFPGGTIGNSYNYLTDNFHVNDHTSSNLITYNNQGNTLGYDAYKSFVGTSRTSTYMLNIMLGTVATAKAEYENRRASGTIGTSSTSSLNFKWVELGNEMYLSDNQQGPDNLLSNVTDATSYVSHVKQICDGISFNVPPTKAKANVAVCIDNDDFTNTAGWNKTLSLDQTYFDAVTLHNYNDPNLFFHSGR